MKVSIVTLSFNQGKFLRRALRSVLEQNYPVEYIVVDPGSTDGSREIISAYRNEIAHVVLQPDDGPAHGLNRGCAAASGDVLAYVNADDALLPGAVGEAVEYLAARPELAVVYGDGYLVDADGRVIRSIESSPFNVRRFGYGHVTVLQQATFIRRRAFDQVGGFNAANPVSWDGEILLDIALRGGRLRHVMRKWGAFTLHAEGITGSKRLAAQQEVHQRRLFRRARGRDRCAVDSLLQPCVRAEKWLVSPGRTLRRVGESLTGSPELRLDSTPGMPVRIVAADRQPRLERGRVL